MTEYGTVTEIVADGAQVRVAMAVQEGCANCGNTGCKKMRGAILANNRQAIPLLPGDEVELEIQGKEQAMSAVRILLLPCLALFAGYGLGKWLFPVRDAAGLPLAGAAGEGPAVLCAGIFFLVAVGIGFLMQRGKKEGSFPLITRKI